MGRETYKDIAKGEWNAALLEDQKIFKYIDKLKTLFSPTPPPTKKKKKKKKIKSNQILAHY